MIYILRMTLSIVNVNVKNQKILFDALSDTSTIKTGVKLLGEASK